MSPITKNHRPVKENIRSPALYLFLLHPNVRNFPIREFSFHGFISPWFWNSESISTCCNFESFGCKNQPLHLHLNTSPRTNTTTAPGQFPLLKTPRAFLIPPVAMWVCQRFMVITQMLFAPCTPRPQCPPRAHRQHSWPHAKPHHPYRNPRKTPSNYLNTRRPSFPR